jgi:hypothetical protein
MRDRIAETIAIYMKDAIKEAKHPQNNWSKGELILFYSKHARDAILALEVEGKVVQDAKVRVEDGAYIGEGFTRTLTIADLIGGHSKQ